MVVTFVKTAKASFEHGFLAALEFDGFTVGDIIYLDAVSPSSMRSNPIPLI